MSYCVYHFLVENTCGIGKTKLIPNFKKGDPKFDLGTEHMVLWNALSHDLYLAKLIAFGKNEAELKPKCDSFLFELNSKLGLNDERVVEVKRSSKKKRKSVNSDSEEDDSIHGEKAKKNLHKKMALKAANSILQVLEQKQSTDDQTTEDQAMKMKVKQLEEESAKHIADICTLREENENLKTVIATLQGLPVLLTRMENLSSRPLSATMSRPPSSSSSSSTSIPSPLPRVSSLPRISPLPTLSPLPGLPNSELSPLALTPTETNADVPLLKEKSKAIQISSVLLGRCSMASAAKFTNDILHGLFDLKYMATHSVTGTKSSKNAASEGIKEGIDGAQLQSILSAVKAAFPERTDTEIKSYIRVKLNNAATTYDNKNKVQ